MKRPTNETATIVWAVADKMLGSSLSGTIAILEVTGQQRSANIVKATKVLIMAPARAVIMQLDGQRPDWPKALLRTYSAARRLAALGQHGLPSRPTTKAIKA